MRLYFGLFLFVLLGFITWKGIERSRISLSHKQRGNNKLMLLFQSQVRKKLYYILIYSFSLYFLWRYESFCIVVTGTYLDNRKEKKPQWWPKKLEPSNCTESSCSDGSFPNCSPHVSQSCAFFLKGFRLLLFFSWIVSCCHQR